MPETPLHILVFNCGSSSLTFSVFRREGDGRLERLISGKGRRVGVAGDAPSTMEFLYQGKLEMRQISLPDHRTAAIEAIEGIQSRGIGIDMIGHRWPNGMDYFSTQLITTELMPTLRRLVPIIPIHHSISLAVIAECRTRFPALPQYVTTDNAFHKDLPKRASEYVLSKDILDRHGFKKIGFHGLSFRYVAERVPQMIGISAEEAKLVICHLGTGGSEIAAVAGGRSMDVSMGYTGLPGVLMSTRSGDMDGLLPIYLMGNHDLDVDEIQDLLNNKSGVRGVSALSSDIRDLVVRAERGEETAKLAVDMYIRGVKKFIGSFVTALGGIHCLVFTDDVGVMSHRIREGACSGLSLFGIQLDVERNQEKVGDDGLFVHAEDSAVKILVMHTDEELVMAEEGVRLQEEVLHG